MYELFIGRVPAKLRGKRMQRLPSRHVCFQNCGHNMCRMPSWVLQPIADELVVYALSSRYLPGAGRSEQFSILQIVPGWQGLVVEGRRISTLL